MILEIVTIRLLSTIDLQNCNPPTRTTFLLALFLSGIILTNDASELFEQAYRHQLFIDRLLHSWHIRLPVEYAVVIVNQNAVLDESLRGFPIFHLSGLRRYINNLFLKYPARDVKLEQVSNQLLRLIHRHPPKRRINDTDRFKKGVLCMKCDFKSSMAYQNRSWCCRMCGTRDKNALRWALHDYRLLIGQHITNQQFREFVGIESMQVASKILSRLGFEKIGDKKGRFYIIPEDCLLSCLVCLLSRVFCLLSHEFCLFPPTG